MKSLFRRMRKGKKSSSTSSEENMTEDGSFLPSSPKKGESSIEFELELETLRRRLEESELKNQEKQMKIEDLETKLQKDDIMVKQNEGLEAKLTSFLLDRAAPLVASPVLLERPQKPDINLRGLPIKHRTQQQVKMDPDLHQSSTKEAETSKFIERWLLEEASRSVDVDALVSKYAELCLTIGIPLDRLQIFYKSPNHWISSFHFKWEFGMEFKERESPPGVTTKQDEAFSLLLEGQEMEYRVNESAETIPEGYEQFFKDGFRDYFAFPLSQGGTIVGAMAWSTRSAGGFREDNINLFKKTSYTMSTLIGNYAKDRIITSLINTFKVEVREQTMELADANRSLTTANERIVKQAERQLRNFAMMSHEIRTPLNCIIGMSNLLLDSDVDDSIKESVEMIIGSGDLLLAVVDDVLDYSKLATGKVETRIKVTNIHKTFQAVVKSVEIRAKEMGLVLKTNIAENIPSVIETDGRRLQQIFFNLLGNAIKFGCDGQHVDFNVDRVRRDTLELIVQSNDTSDDDIIQCSIKDYGNGIQPSEIEKIFYPFQQAATNDPTCGGTGLGLAITKQLVRVLGGSISVQSEYGSWCKFVVLLPTTPNHPINKNQYDDGRCPQGQTSGAHRELRQLLDSAHVSTIHDASEGDRMESDGCSWSDDDTTSSISTSTSAQSSAQTFPSLSMHGTDINKTNKPNLLTDTEAKDVFNSIQQHVSDISDSTTRKEKSTAKPILNLTEFDIQHPGEGIDYGNLKVLVAEDNKINQKVLKRTLDRIGFSDIDIVSDGKQAVDAFEAKYYDIVFMDLQMPIMDGLEATTIISAKKDERGLQYPKVAFLTAHALVDYQQKAAAAGGDGFISKPYKMEIIKELVARFMGYDGV